MKVWLPWMTWLFWLSLVLVCGSGCGTKVQPLADATFRLDSKELNDCKKSAQPVLCTAEIKGVIDERAVTEPGDTVADCKQCVFNQKIVILDSNGTRHSFFYKLPTGQPIPVNLGEPAHIVYIEADRLGKGFAMSLRDDKGNLIAALSSGAGGEFLAEQQRLGQISIQTDPAKNAGEEKTECGTKIYRVLQVQDGDASVSAAPGETQTLQGKQRSYLFTNINRFNWQNSTCTDRTTPFAYVLYRTASSN